MWFGLPPTRILELFVGRRCGASYCLPVRFERLATSLCMPWEELRRLHTMHPYAMAFVSNERVEAYPYSYMQYASHSSIFRACLLCIERDLRDHGESYWHRAHMLPGVNKCLEHNSDLVVPVAAGPNTCTRALQLATPHMCRLTQNSSPLMTAPFQSVWNQISVATLTQDWVRRESWNEIYEARAAELGYIRKDGKVAALPLAKDLAEALGSDFLRCAGLHSASSRASLWPSILLKPPSPSAPVSTPKHIALATFLGRASEKHRLTQYAPPGKHRSPYADLDANALQMLARRWTELRAHGERCTVKDLLSETGVSSLLRHNRTLFPAVTQFIQLFRTSDQSMRQLGKRKRERNQRPQQSGPMGLAVSARGAHTTCTSK